MDIPRLLHLFMRKTLYPFRSTLQRKVVPNLIFCALTLNVLIHGLQNVRSEEGIIEKKTEEKNKVGAERGNERFFSP